MAALRFQYSIRTMLLATAVVAVGLYFVMLPTRRANQFAQAIRSGRSDAAEKIVSGGGDFSCDSEIQIEPMSVNQLWKGIRIVRVSDPLVWQNVTFTITFRKDSSSGLYLLD